MLLPGRMARGQGGREFGHELLPTLGMEILNPNTDTLMSAPIRKPSFLTY